MHFDMTKILSRAVLGLLIVMGYANAQDVPGFVFLSDIPTNIFITEPGGSGSCISRLADGLGRFGSGRFGVFQRDAEAALKSPECRSAEQDPEGHWGPAVGGWQISLRLPKDQFAPEEQVTATVIIRNLSTNNMTFRFRSNESLPITWVRQEDKLRSPPGFQINADSSFISLGYSTLFPRTQRKFDVVAGTLPLTNRSGTYSLSASAHVQRPDGRGEFALSSGSATIRIAPQSKDRK